MDNNRIGENIKKIRELKNFTQDYVASKLDIARETFGRMERGEVDFKLQTIFDIAVILETSYQKILEFDTQVFLNATHNTNTNLINGNNVHTGTSDDILKMLVQTFSMLQEQQATILTFLKK